MLGRLITDRKNPGPPQAGESEHKIFESFRKRARQVEAGFESITSITTLRSVYTRLLSGEPKNDLRRTYGKDALREVTTAGIKLCLLQSRDMNGGVTKDAPASILDVVLAGRLRTDGLDAAQQIALAEEVLIRGNTDAALKLLLSRLGLTGDQLEKMFTGELPATPRTKDPAAFASPLPMREHKRAEVVPKKNEPVEEPVFVGELTDRTRTIYDLSVEELGEFMEHAAIVSDYGMREAPLLDFLDDCHLPLPLYRELMPLESPQDIWDKLRSLQRKIVKYAPGKVERRRAAAPPPSPSPSLAGFDAIESDPAVDDILEDDVPEMLEFEDEPLGELEDADVEDSEADGEVETLDTDSGEGKAADDTDKDAEDDSVDSGSTTEYEATDAPPPPETTVNPELKEGDPQATSLPEDPKARTALLILLQALPYYVEEADCEGSRQQLCAVFGVTPEEMGGRTPAIAAIQFRDTKRAAYRKHMPVFVGALTYLCNSPYIERGGKGCLDGIFSLNPTDRTRWAPTVGREPDLYDFRSFVEIPKPEDPTVIEGDEATGRESDTGETLVVGEVEQADPVDPPKPLFERVIVERDSEVLPRVIPNDDVPEKVQVAEAPEFQAHEKGGEVALPPAADIVELQNKIEVLQGAVARSDAQQNAFLQIQMQQTAMLGELMKLLLSQRSPVAAGEGTSVVRVVIDLQVNGQGVLVRPVSGAEPVASNSPKAENGSPSN